MNVVVLLMLMALLGADATAAYRDPVLTGWAMPVSVCGTLGIIAGVAWLLASLGMRVMDRQPEHALPTVERVQRLLELCRWATLVVFAVAAHLLGWVAWIARTSGMHLVIADVIAVAPALLVIVFTWWAYYPIDRRLRQAELIGQLDRGESIGRIGSRWRYTLWQVRHQMALFIVLFGGLLLWSHVVKDLLPLPADPPWLGSVLTSIALPIALAATPLLIRYLWDIEPLADGPLRDRLAGLCDAYHVRVRDLLVWRTTGGMVNAAVLGFLGRLRYIIVTDGMIERLRNEEVEAVMAHEIGHIVHRHVPWMVVCLIAVISALTFVVDQAARAVLLAMHVDRDALPQPDAAAIDGGLMMLVLGIAAIVFGVISRRIERQADTFAAQHFAARSTGSDESPGVIGTTDAEIVAEMLHRIAVLNHVPIRRRAWRHGSIASRIASVKALIGKPINACPIDALVRRTFYACLLLLIVVMLAMTIADSGTTI